ncbi:ATP synthase subunit I [Cereibacter johrii]|uniref:N-ATPase subunit AtpR n=1 Tax=Cereibacter johrii TaxID=445629 RepID=UPI003CF3F8BF
MTGLLLPLAALSAGILAGALHFATLRPLSDRLLRGDLGAIPLQLLRLALLAAFLVLCSRGGAATLLGAAAGILGGRALILRRERAR